MNDSIWTAEAQLGRLYARRVALDILIRSLERYERYPIDFPLRKGVGKAGPVLTPASLDLAS